MIIGLFVGFLGGVQKHDIGRLVGDESEVYQCLIFIVVKLGFGLSIYPPIHPSCRQSVYPSCRHSVYPI